MASISVGAAAGAGFQLIGRRPVSVISWGVFNLLLGVAPVVMLLALLAPQIMDLARQAQAHPGFQPAPGVIVSMIGHVLLFIPLIWTCAIIARTVLIGAVFRAVLEPKQRAFAYLRLGMREIWLFLVMLVQGIVFGVGMLMVMGVVVVIAHTVKVYSSGGLALLVMLVLRLAAYALFIWIGLRLSMALPMTFAERRFRLFESWGLTRGHAGDLFLVGLLMVMFVLIIEVVAVAVVGGVLIALGANLFAHPQGAATFFQQPPEVWMRGLAPYLIGLCVMMALIVGPLEAIFLAPWAAAYRMLTGEAEAG